MICKDGLKLSVQAGETYHSKPAKDQGPWLAFEVYSSTKEPLLLPYSEGDWSTCNYVPKAIIEQVIKKHGGLVQGDFPSREGEYFQ